MKVVLASKNKHKLVEISKITEKFDMELVLQSELGVDIDVEETGTTFEENSFLIFMRDMKSFLVSRYFLIFILTAAPSLAISLYVDYMKCRRKNVRYIKF